MPTFIGRERRGAGFGLLLGIAVAATVLLTALEPAPAAGTCAASDPCAAKKTYDQNYPAAQKREQETYAALQKVKAPDVPKPPGTAAQYEKQIREIKAHGEYLAPSELAKLDLWLSDTSNIDRRVKAHADAERLDTLLDRLKSELSGTDDPQKKAALEKRIEAARLEFKAANAQLALFAQAERRAEKAEEANRTIKDWEKVLAIARHWEAFEGARKTWEVADARAKQLKEDYEIVSDARTQALANAKAKYADEQARIKATAAALQNAPRDAAYSQKVKSTTIRAQASLENILLFLVDFDCFPDVRAYMDALKGQIKKLDKVRDTILAQNDVPGRPAVSPYGQILGGPVRPVRPVKPTPPVKGGVVWVCDGPVVSKGSAGMKVSGSSATFQYQQNGKTGEGTINWAGVPLTVREGETVTLTMNATGTSPAAALGWFNVNCDGERGTWDNNAASYPGGDTASPTPSATLVFKFQPRGSEAMIQIVAGMNGGNSTGILYKYHRK